ncbi:MAG: phosphomannomutase, partial [Peptococcaceae bacterium]|nr:phosphomannomutase [Peptococcaceae bacterium]
MINSQIFRQYDIRGQAERDLTDETIVLLGKAFGTFVQRTGTRQVVVGMDNRLSSERLHRALVNGLLASGCDVIDLGLVVTPILYYAREHFGVDGGVMITGSHNPPEDNGFKIALGSSTIYGSDIGKLKTMMEAKDFLSGAGHLERRDGITPYLNMLKEKICLGQRKLKVAVDCGNGTAALFAEQVLEGWGCEVVPLHCTSD